MKNKKILYLLTFAIAFLTVGILSCDDEPVSGNYNLVITGLNPDSGYVGTTVLISGTGFAPNPEDNRVTFHNTPAQVTKVVPGQITAIVPAGATTGPVELTVGTESVVGPSFTVLTNNNGGEQLGIVSAAPTSGPVGTEVTIEGSGFNSDPSKNNVTFNGTPAPVIQVVQGDVATIGKTQGDSLKIETAAADSTSDVIIVKVPNGATTGSIQISVGGETVTGPTFTVTTGAPTISGISPTSGPVGTTVTISGSNFSATASGNIVKFNGTPATVTGASETELIVTVPTGATDGAVTVKVGNQTAMGPEFDVTTTTPPAPPTITKVDPTTGETCSIVTITGTNFSATASENIVKFGSEAATVTSASATQLEVAVPSALTTGTSYDITVTVDGQTVKAADQFTVSGDGCSTAPVITGITPTSGPVGTEVTINGSNFSTTAGDNVVNFNGTPATVKSASDTVLVVIVPPGATDGPVTVTVNGETGTGPNFDVTPTPPTITKVDPLSGDTCTDVTITGTNFSATASENVVEFNGVQASITSASATELVVTVPAGATDGKITVTVNGLAVTGPDFDVTGDGCSAPAPTITGINPTSGPVGTTVTITGTNYSTTTSENIVNFNGTPATVTSATATELVVTVPVGATDGDVTVTVNGQTATGPNFDVTATPPTITKVDPLTGETCSVVTITGTAFSATLADNVVKFGTETATVTSATATELKVTVPSALTVGQSYDVTVTVGSLSVTAANKFEVTGDGCSAPAPTITGINPTSGSIGTSVTLTGTNFGATVAGNEVKFGSTVATVTAATATELTVTVPGGLTTGTSYDVTVKVNSQTATAPDKFTVTATPPTITKVDPLTGETCSVVTITGTAFSATLADNVVKFGTETATVTSATATELKVTVPSALTVGQSYDVTVTVGSLSVTAANKFEVTGDGCSAPAPTITGINPTSGPVGTTVTITGTNYSTTTSENIVNFNGTPATVTSATATELVVTVPTGATDGAVTVTVGGQTATGPNFDVTVDTTPTITKVDPLSGETCSVVTITGTNFSTTKTDNVVKFGTETATVTSATATELKVTVPSALTVGQSYSVSVTVGSLSVTAANKFDVTGDGCTTPPPAPTITAINPTSGPIGTEVTIIGTNFSTTAADNTVEFNGTAATVKSATATELVVDVPTGATDGAVTVTVGGQTATGPNFDVTQPAPTITAINPTSGPVGTEVIITGTNFSTTAADNTVEFNGTAATVKSATATELVVDVPTGATDGAVTVTVGGQTATGPNFDVTQPAPTITGIIPTVGAVGTEVTIQGTNFSATASENTVTFNGTTVTVINSASPTELVVEVPVGATSGPVAVTVNGQTATGPDFTVLEEGQPEFPIIGAGASVEVGTRGICLGCGVTNEQNVVDLSLNNFGLVQASAGVAGSVYVSAHSAGDIPAGGEAGFVVRNQGSLIGAGLLDDITLTTYLDGVQQEQVSGTQLLTLELVSGSNDKQFIFFTTTMPFDEIEIEFGGVVSAGDNFEVYAAYGGKEAATVPDPLIGGFTPERGPEGTEVTITGINFSATAADNTVTFNGTQAVITSASETELVVTVPTGATTGKIEVLVGGKTATSTEDFIVGSIPLTGPNLDVVIGTRGLCLLCSIDNEGFVIDTEPDNYATMTIKLGVAGSTYLAVEDLDTEYDPATNPGGISKVGFVVARSGGVIDLGLLQNITIETYLNGTLQESFTDTGLAVVDLLSGSSTTRKFIGADATMKFDQILIDFNALVGADITYEVYGVHTNYFVK